MVKIPADFFGDFPLGDRVETNMFILRNLYDAKDRIERRQKWSMNKPILIQLASITEAVLHDFFLRCYQHTGEQSVRIDAAVLEEIRKQQEIKVQFGPLLKMVDRHEIFQHQHLGYPEFRDDLELLRNLRDRVHIALFRKKGTGLTASEGADTYSDRQVKNAEKVLKFILKVLLANHERPDHAKGFVSEFDLPWEEHLLPHQFYRAPMNQAERDAQAEEYAAFMDYLHNEGTTEEWLEYYAMLHEG